MTRLFSYLIPNNRIEIQNRKLSIYIYFIDSSSPALSGRSGGAAVKRANEDLKANSAKIAKTQ